MFDPNAGATAVSQVERVMDLDGPFAFSLLRGVEQWCQNGRG